MDEVLEKKDDGSVPDVNGHGAESSFLAFKETVRL